MALYSLKVYGTDNTGDSHCNPLAYYPPPEKVTALNIIQSPRPVLTAHDTVVIGGGGLLNHCEDWDATLAYFLASPARVVVWAAGTNRHYGEPPLPPLAYFNALVGLRDCTFHRHVPCASCKHPIFDDYHGTAPNHAIGVISHRDHAMTSFAAANRLPHIDNAAPLVDLIRFIAAHRYILANTYHALYWCWLLDRTPLLAMPFSTRFDHFPFPTRLLAYPSMAGLVDAAKSFDYHDPTALHRARAANDAFYRLVQSR